MGLTKYEGFKISDAVERNDRSNRNTRLYHGLVCPHCNDEFAFLPTESLRNNKATCCRSHLLKCPAYECASCEHEVSATPCLTFVMHGKCIEERETLQQEKSSLEQKLDRMSQQLTDQRNEMKQQTESIIQHADKRWSSFAMVMVHKFPTLREPVNDETIPAQMQQHTQSLLLKDVSERETMRLRIQELERTNRGLLEQQQILNDRFKAAIIERDERVETPQYKRLLGKFNTQAEEVIEFKNENVRLQTVIQKLDVGKRKRSRPFKDKLQPLDSA